MKKILALTLVFGMQYVAANPNGINEPTPPANNNIFVENYADLAVQLTLRYGNGKSMAYPISAKNPSGCPEEFVGLNLSGLEIGLYNIAIQRDKPGATSILTSLLRATQAPRILNAVDGEEKQEGNELFWNMELKENTNIVIQLRPATDNGRRLVLVQLKNNSPVNYTA